MQAVLLAGGLGTRLRSVVADRPKPMALIGDKPFMEYVVLELKNHGITEIIFAVGYKGSMVEEYFGDGARLGITEPDSEPSSWREFLDKNGDGIHHIAFMTRDREPVVQYFEENGMPVRHYGEYTGGNYTVFDSKEKFGTFIQVKEDKNL